MVSQAALSLRVITLWFLALSHFLEMVWLPLRKLGVFDLGIKSIYSLRLGLDFNEEKYLKSLHDLDLDRTMPNVKLVPVISTIQDVQVSS